MSSRLNNLLAAGLLAAGAMTGYVVGINEQPVVHKLVYPQVAVSYFHTNTLQWRLAVTNDFVFWLNPSNGTRLKFDYVFKQNVNAITELDNNWR